MKLLITFVLLVSPAFAQREASLQEQTLCYKQAKAVFEERKPAPDGWARNIVWDFSAHYSRKQNVCFGCL